MSSFTLLPFSQLSILSRPHCFPGSRSVLWVSGEWYVGKTGDEVRKGHNNISFTCRENSSAATAVQGTNRRPANSRRREKEKRRREIWLERRKHPSSAGPPQSSQQPQPQQHLQVISAAAESAAAVILLLVGYLAIRCSCNSSSNITTFHSTPFNSKHSGKSKWTSVSNCKKKAANPQPAKYWWSLHQPAWWLVWDPQQSYCFLSRLLSNGTFDRFFLNVPSSSNIQPNSFSC